MKRFDSGSCVCLLLLLTGIAHGNDTELVIGTWGGPYEDAQKTVLFTPFSTKTDVQILTREYFGGLDALRESSPPDVFDMLEEEALIACDEGLIIQLDTEQLMGSDATSQVNNRSFLENTLSTCSVAHLTSSTLIAFDERAFPGEKPQRIADLFDIEKFPGKRGLKKEPSAILEWALMAEGVPNSQVYNLLSTERGMTIALKQLNAVREHIVWWDKPADAVALLEQGEVVMASGYNGRFFDSWRQGAPISMIWNGQIIDRSVWVISSRNSDNEKSAYDFIRFALHPERQAKIAERIPYGPTHQNAARYIGMHPDAGISMTEHLPTSAHHLQDALFRDTQWYARTDEFRRRHFNAWLSK